MYLFAELQKIPFLLQLSVGKIGHLILKELISIRESKSNYSNVMATHDSTVMLSPSPHCRPPFEIKRKKKSSFWQHFSTEASWGSVTHGTRSAGFGGACPVSIILSTLQAAASALPSPALLSAGVWQLLPEHTQSFLDKQPLKQHRTNVLCISAAISQDEGL